MDVEQLDVLEAKVNQAIAYIEKLKLENQDLKKTNQELQSETQTKEELIQQLREENRNLQQLQSESSIGKEKEEKIRSKVELMLSKLDELQFNV
ncbi:cell division protein ZapB [candidate division KSB1 bacterium]|nr:cell division protein ZapB [candidate division KSB1 bacterium]